VIDTGATDPSFEGGYGYGIGAFGRPNVPAEVVVRGSVIDSATDHGVLVRGLRATLEHVTVRNTRPNTEDDTGGRGLSVAPSAFQTDDPYLEVSGSLVEGSRNLGVSSFSAELVAERLRIRDTKEKLADGFPGYGLILTPSTTMPSAPTGALVGLAIEQTKGVGAVFVGATATIDRLLIADTQPITAEYSDGIGMLLEGYVGFGPSVIELTGSAIRDATTAGIFSRDSLLDARQITIERVAQDDGYYGDGIYLDGGESLADLSLELVRIEDVREVGIFAEDIPLSVRGSVVRGVASSADGLFGDGVTIQQRTGLAALTMERCLLADSARAGLSSFGAPVALAASRMDCNAIDLNGEQAAGSAYDFTDQGGNLCGCGEDTEICKVLSTSLEPPVAPDSEVEEASEGEEI
jgi:hypothetical protein